MRGNYRPTEAVSYLSSGRADFSSDGGYLVVSTVSGAIKVFRTEDAFQTSPKPQTSFTTANSPAPVAPVSILPACGGRPAILTGDRGQMRLRSYTPIEPSLDPRTSWKEEECVVLDHSEENQLLVATVSAFEIGFSTSQLITNTTDT